MKQLLTSSKLWTAIALWSAFWVVEPFVEHHEYLFDVMNALSVSVGIGILIAYSEGIYESLVTKRPIGGHWLILGIAVTWVASSVRQIWNWAWRWLDQPLWMINHPFVAFLVWVLVTGGALHLMSKNAIEGQIPRRNWLRLGWWVALGLSVGLIVAIFLEEPNIETYRPR
jgi:hypothetical protein